MENFKSIIFSIIGLAILSYAGFWAFSTIESGSTHVNNQRQKELEEKNEILEQEIVSLKSKIGLLEEKETDIVKEEVKTVEKIPEKEITKTVVETKTLKYQTLINELQKLVDANIYMKKGSSGERVGTVQKFLNIYNKTSNKVDNDYGPNMVTLVSKFQKDQGLSPDGEAGPGTFKKMIEWLKKQG